MLTKYQGAKVDTLAQIMNLSPRRIQQLVKDGILPRPNKGKYDLPVCIAAYVKYIRDLPSGKSARVNLRKEQTRLIGYQADIAAMESKEMGSQLISSEIAHKEIQKLSGEIARQARSIGSKVATIVRQAKPRTVSEIKRIIDQVTSQTLKNISHYNAETGKCDAPVKNKGKK